MMRKIILMSLAVSMVVVVASASAASTPTVATGPASRITNAGARLHATVNPEGTNTTFKFEYGLTNTYGSASSTGQAGRAVTAIAVQEPIGGLNPGTVYHYRIDATNRFGTTFGVDRRFTTTGRPLPGAITGAPLNVTKTMVTLTGTVVTQDQTTSFVFDYGTTASYGVETSAQNATASTAPTGVSDELTGLVPGTTFHYRLVAEHAGTPPEYGADQTFTTIPSVRLRSRVTARTTPVHARRKPYLFTTTGTVVAPSSLPPGVACTGAVVIRFLHGRRSVAFRTVPLQANCTFSTQILFRRLVDRTKSRLKVAVRFRGNAYLRPAVSRAQRVMLG